MGVQLPRRRFCSVVASASALLLAGCSGGGGGNSNPDDASGGSNPGDGSGNGDSGDDSGNGQTGYGSEFTAKEGLDQARKKAKEWSEGAQLRGVFTVERPSEGAAAVFTGGDRSPPSFADPSVTDETVGNGLAAAWNYNFASQDAGTLVVTLHADGSVETSEPKRGYAGSSFESWEVDSKAALETAKNNDEFAAILDHEEATVAVALFSNGQSTLWRVRATNPDADGSPGVEVDATSGDSYQYAS